MRKTFLAGLSPSAFLRKHWQKRPLVIRGALPQYRDLIDRKGLISLAGRDDIQSRLITRSRGQWGLEHGPFPRRRFARLPATDWTLLVQGVNQSLPRAATLLAEFAFLPFARLDDVMVSYAPPGGGVGPHFDSYDVFLLQVAGTRRWRVSLQTDLELVEGAPLKLLRRFKASQEWLLEPGDMLYLPPHAAHDGIAVTDCLTASIGFRAPGAQEIGVRFLEFVQDRLELPGTYRDPELIAQRTPARIGTDMLGKIEQMIGRISWRRADILEFLGCYLTEPKPQVFFSPPRRPLAAARFAARLRQRGAALSLKTLMLYRGDRVFINGESHTVEASALSLLQRLADERRIEPPVKANARALTFLYQWYRAGYINLGSQH